MRRVTRLLTFVFLAFASSCASAQVAKHTEGAAPKLNVVLMLADDMGYADINAFGGRFGYTPHLDQLAASGMTMTQFYSACAVCSPTRAALLTGRYPLANGIDGHFPDKPSTFLRDQTRPDGGYGTLPGILKEQGYATMHIGKWHLGGITLVELNHRAAGEGEYVKNQGPHEHGFDQYIVSQEDTSTRVRSGLIRSRQLYQNATKHLIINDVYEHKPDATRDWQAYKGDAAAAFIAKNVQAGEPFYLNLWFDVPHMPYEDAHIPAEFHFDTLSKVHDKKLGRMRHVLNTKSLGEKRHEDHTCFLGMVTYLDHQVGRVIAALNDPNGDGDMSDSIADNTLVIFASDNGGAWPGDNGVFASGKASIREGGIRVPMMVALPGKIAPGTESSQIGNTIDFMPSIFKMVGMDGPPQGVTVDGIDLSPVWIGAASEINRGTMFSDLRTRYNPQRDGPHPDPKGHLIALRGDLKVIFKSKGDIIPVALYDLSRDASETTNLVQDPAHAATIDAMTQEAKAWVTSMQEASSR